VANRISGDRDTLAASRLWGLMYGADIEVSDLRLTYRVGSNDVHALDGLDLKVPSGQFLVARGPSGSGKSSLLETMAGLRTADAGRVVIGDTDVTSLSEGEADVFRRENIGLVFQFFNLIPSLSVSMNVALPLLLGGKRLRQVRDQVDAWIEVVDLQKRTEHRITELSGGEMQRVAIARALIAQPKVILADEPTGNLDVRASHRVFRLMKDQAQKLGITTIMMTHDAEAVSYADRVINIADGRIAKDFGVAPAPGTADGI
jgi:putative ABC transport system ATP-binding protein